MFQVQVQVVESIKAETESTQTGQTSEKFVSRFGRKLIYVYTTAYLLTVAGVCKYIYRRR